MWGNSASKRFHIFLYNIEDNKEKQLNKIPKPYYMFLDDRKRAKYGS